MNALGISFAWLAAQVTLLSAATAVVYLLTRRRRPAAGVTSVLSGLLLSVLLTLSFVSPWPCWSSRDVVRSAASEAPVQGSDVGGLPAVSLPVSETESATGPGAATGQRAVVGVEPTTTVAPPALWRRLANDLGDSAPQPDDAGYTWAGWFAVSLLLLSLVGIVRFLGGWLSVRNCVRRSRVLSEDAVNELVAVLCTELGCRRTVELRESRELASAATAGWWRPVILLPGNWRQWSDRELRAVLAHELAHVAAGDAATWLAAQFGLSLQFYHPFVHWLTGRLRLEQELAADAVAARLIGNPQLYLTTLAELAVRQPHQSIAWPARAFLPAPGTLVRRIEMLRTNNALLLKATRRQHAAITAVILAFGIGVAGLRPLTPHPVTAQTPATAMNEDQAPPPRPVTDDARSGDGAVDVAGRLSRVVDADGQPIAGAIVECTTQLRYAWLEPPAPLGKVVTNEQGEFAYPENLPDLDYFFVIVNAEGFLERFWTANSDAYRKQDGVRLPDTLTLLRPATISGTIIDEQGKPLPDAEIYVDYYFDAGPASLGGNRVTSDANGRFTATNVPPANVFVRYESPATYTPGEWPGPTGVQPVRFCIAYRQPTDGQTIDDVVLDLRRADRVVEGRVVDQAGQGLAGVAVKAGYFPAVQRIDETIAVKTDSDGKFRFTGLTPDTFVIWVGHSGPSDTVTLTKDQPARVTLTMADPVVRGSESKPEDPKRTAWGEPNADGLVAGIRVDPPAESHAIGDLIQVHLVVRNPTKETKTLDYSFSGQADLHALNSDRETIAQINYFRYLGINVIRSYSLEPGFEAMIGSFEVGLTAAGDTDNSPPPIQFPIACRPGEQYVLRYYLSQQPGHEWTTGDAPLVCKDRPPVKERRSE